jgi:hypothetical protein
MALEGDPIGVLRWLAHQAEACPGATLWDSDVMRAFEWDAQRAQNALVALEREDCVTTHAVRLTGQTFSMGYLRITRKGQTRLGGPMAYPARRSVILERLRHPLSA